MLALIVSIVNVLFASCHLAYAHLTWRASVLFVSGAFVKIIVWTTPLQVLTFPDCYEYYRSHQLFCSLSLLHGLKVHIPMKMYIWTALLGWFGTQFSLGFDIVSCLTKFGCFVFKLNIIRHWAQNKHMLLCLLTLFFVMWPSN